MTEIWKLSILCRYKEHITHRGVVATELSWGGGKENELWWTCYKAVNTITAVALLLRQNYFNKMLPSFVYLSIDVLCIRIVLPEEFFIQFFLIPMVLLHQKISPSPKPCGMVRNMTSFYAEDLLAYCPTPKLKDHNLSTVGDCLLGLLNRKHDYHRKK